MDSVIRGNGVNRSFPQPSINPMKIQIKSVVERDPSGSFVCSIPTENHRTSTFDGDTFEEILKEARRIADLSGLGRKVTLRHDRFLRGSDDEGAGPIIYVKGSYSGGKYSASSMNEGLDVRAEGDSFEGLNASIVAAVDKRLAEGIAVQNMAEKPRIFLTLEAEA